MHLRTPWRGAPAAYLMTLAAGLVLSVALGTGAAHATPAKLLLQSVCVQASAQEYIAIYNPNDVAVDLSNYYITDAWYTADTWYIYIVNPSAGKAGGGAYYDFNIRFPAGATIAAHDTVAIATQGSASFITEYGRKPAFEIPYTGYENDAESQDMRAAFAGSVGATPADNTLTNGSESVVLYYWDQESDLVVDIDYVVWGATASCFVDKSGKSVDGPDADTTPTAYQNDTPQASQAIVAAGAHNYDMAFRREDYSEGTQKTTGGNGVGGRDETSENLGTTWSSTNPASPPFIKGGAPPVQVLTAKAGGPYTGTVGTPVSVTGAASTPATGQTISAYAWNFGDGGTGSGVTATHTYTAAGTYTVTLTVTGSGGGTASASTTATITSGGTTPGAAKKLLLQAICVQASAQEYIAVYNPNNEAVDLSNYYITDAWYTADTWYIYIVNPSAGKAGGGAYYDFHIRFPAGATIAAHDTVAIATQGSASFITEYGRKPAFEIPYTGYENDAESQDMRAAFAGSVGATPADNTLTNGSESVILYYWDQESDLVVDIDYGVWGATASCFVDKSGKSVDGPDADTTPTAYKNDTPQASQAIIAAGAHNYDMAFRREDYSEGTQKTTGGNGVGGRDETSENLGTTWSSDQAAVPPFFPKAPPTNVLTARPGGPYSGQTGQAIAFNGSASTPGTGETITQYDWTFGDSGTGSGVTTTHTYNVAGTYTVTLTVHGSGGGTASASTTCTVTVAGQITAVPGGPYSGEVNKAVTFNGSGSLPPAGGSITGYAWNFGDGGTGTGATVTHAYSAVGTYTVSLTVTGSTGTSDTKTTTATITAAAVSTDVLQVPARTFLPTRGETIEIGILVPSGSNATLRIYDLEGREVMNLYDSAPTSLAKVTWNGRDSNLMLVPAGTYICSLEVRLSNGNVRTYTAPIVVARVLGR